MGITKKLLRKISSGVSSVSGRGKPADRAASRDEAEKEVLLVRLGGMVVLASIVSEFCHRATEDPRLQKFFAGVDPRALSAHQKRFFAMAFTSIDKDKAEQTIRRAHTRLFSMGLNEVHFDIFTEHLSQTLRDRGFGDAIVVEATAVVLPLREIFREVALGYSAQQSVMSATPPFPFTSENEVTNLQQVVRGA